TPQVASQILQVRKWVWTGSLFDAAFDVLFMQAPSVPANRRESKGSVDHSATKTNDQKQRAPIKGASPLRLLHKQKPQPVAAVRGASADGSIALLGDGDGHAVHVVGHGDLAGQTGIVLERIRAGHQLVFVFVALAGFFEPATFDVHVTGGAGTH